MGGVVFVSARGSDAAGAEIQAVAMSVRAWPAPSSGMQSAPFRSIGAQADAEETPLMHRRSLTPLMAGRDQIRSRCTG
jgi:hypothetical protein